MKKKGTLGFIEVSPSLLKMVHNMTVAEQKVAFRYVLLLLSHVSRQM